MKSNLFSFLVLTVAIIISSCTDTQIVSSDSVLKSIPKDVSMVTAINAEAILEKADFDNVKEMAFYQELINETKRYNATLGEVLANPAQSGVDLSKNIYISHLLDNDNPEEVFVAVIASVKDKAALETLINSNPDLKISKQANFDVAMKGSQSVAWNGEKVVLGMTNSYGDPITNLEKFFNTTSENSIAGDQDLNKAMSGNHDISSWMSSNAIASSPSLRDALIMASIDPDAAKDNFIHGYVDFNDGAIESQSDMYFQSALMEDVSLLFKDQVTTDFSSYIPANANSMMTASLDLEGVQQVLQKKGVLMMANYGIKEYGLTVEDIASTFGGDILVYTTPGDNETPIATFATNVSSKDKLDKFLALATDFNILEKLGDKLYGIKGTGMLSGSFSGPDAQLLIQDDMIVISGSPEQISKIAAGGYSGKDQIDSAKIKNLKNNIFSGFTNLSDLIKSSGGEQSKLDLNFEDMNFSTNRKKGSFKLDFKDKNSNGLKQLFESINEIYLADKKGTI
ncbi:MAG: hypothetical protein ACI81W_003266 [Saprospiraceae bacterium]|jgi:hypothetical protein